MFSRVMILRMIPGIAGVEFEVARLAPSPLEDQTVPLTPTFDTYRGFPHHRWGAVQGCVSSQDIHPLAWRQFQLHCSFTRSNTH